MSDKPSALRNLKPLFKDAVCRVLVDCDEFTELSAAEEHNLKSHCGDQSVGLVDIACQKGLKDFPKQSIDWIAGSPYKPKSPNKRLILVLESPHIAEFENVKNGRLKPKGPAKGKTGIAIRSHLKEILDINGMELSDRELILINAIQFRCSLGRNLNRKTSVGRKNIRQKNLLFCELIRKEEFADNLEHRIRLVYRQGRDDIVMNAVSLNTSWSCCVSRIIARVTGFCACGIGHPTGWSRSLANSKRFAKSNVEKSLKSRCADGMDGDLDKRGNVR